MGLKTRPCGVREEKETNYKRERKRRSETGDARSSGGRERERERKITEQACGEEGVEKRDAGIRKQQREISKWDQE